MIPDSIKAWGLGEGESAVLAWCVAHRGAEAIIDDLAARRCAAGLGISVRGTLGLVLTAKQQGLVASARSVLETMRGAGMYLSDRILVEALALVGE
jgi:predicted nucleic acid-binding protein